MDYSVQHYIKSMPMQAMREQYQDRDKHLGYCRQCPRYDNLWSCPPLSIDVEVFLGQFSWIYLVCSKINLSEKVIREADTPEKIKDVGWDIMSAVKLDMDDRLRHLEVSFPGSITLSATACNLCEECTRKAGLPCCQPDRMRYAIDAFGFKIVDITKDVFSIDIQWTTDRLPDYYTLVHGFLTNDKMPEALWAEFK